MTKNPVHLVDLFRYYRGLPHQTAALNELERFILAQDPDALNREQDWYQTWIADAPLKDFAAAKELISYLKLSPERLCVSCRCGDNWLGFNPLSRR